MRYDDDITEWKTTRIDNSRPPLRWMANLAGHFASKAVLRISFYEETDTTDGFRFKRDCWIWDSQICTLQGRISNNRNAKIGRQTDKGENQKMDKAKALIASWARSFMAAALALYMAGVTDPKTLAMAGIAAVAPVVLRWLNPQDKSFGLTGK